MKFFAPSSSFSLIFSSFPLTTSAGEGPQFRPFTRYSFKESVPGRRIVITAGSINRLDWSDLQP